MKRLLLALASVVAAGAQAAPRVTIALLPQVEVAGDAVSLGDIARLNSPELALLRQLVHLPVGRVPRDGRPVAVRSDALARWVRRQTGLGEGEVAWQGSEGVQVARRVRLAKGTELADAAVQALRAWMAQNGAGGEIRVSRLPRHIEVPAGDVQLRVRPVGGAPPRGRMLAWVEVWSEGSFVRAVPVALELASPGVTMVREPLDPAATAPASVRHDNAPLWVERGAWATLHSSDGVVALESRVAVLQDGRAGDHVRVRAPGGGGIVFARVVGPARLELAP